MKKELIFPEGFLWGSACSSYQVEGGIDNCNWSEDFPAGKACDYWSRYEDYFTMAEEMHHNVHRLSLEWSRIEPEEGKFDQEAIERYKEMLKSLRKKGMKTMVTLWHYTNPVWLSGQGGWTSFKTPEHFCRYASFVVKELDPYVDFWMTVNEPMISCSHPYIIGKFPPRHRYDFIGCAKAVFNFAQAHKKAYYCIKKINPAAQVGMAENYSFVEPLYKDPLSLFIAKIWDYVRNWMLLEYTKKEHNFIGVNYYFHERVVWDVKYPFVKIENANRKVSDLGVEIYPRGIYKVLKKMKKYRLPVYITENGVADKEDRIRPDFIKDHLKWVHKAIEEDVDVRGYVYWSLLDNFEWAEGYEPRFGLIEMDFEKMKCKARPSALEYAKICKSNKLTLKD